jgi:integrase
MASLRKHPRSPYWFAVFNLPSGTRTNRSTGTTDKRKAQRIANEFEDAADAAGNGRFIESRARKTIADIYTIGNADKLSSSTTADFLDAWLSRKELEAGAKTHEKYSSVISQFKAHLGAKLRRDISAITAADFTKFRDGLALRVSASTANLAVKIVRSAFSQARKDGLVDVNEAERVTLLKGQGRNKARRPFTLPELRRILDVANQEWRGMILVGIYTGLRLGDVATLTWANLDLQQQTLIYLDAEKTDRAMDLPLAEPLYRHLMTLPAGDKPDAPLFPDAAATVERAGRAGPLSNQFHGILVAAGLAKARTHASTGKGRGSKRATGGPSFHTLRHTATSLLKNAGVSDAVARDIIGHETEAMSRNYTHIEMAAKRSAVAKLPDVTGTN